MPLNVTIPYQRLVDHGNWAEWEDVGSTDFLVSYDGSIEGVDYDIEYEQMLAVMSGREPDARDRFVSLFNHGGGPALIAQLLEGGLWGNTSFLEALWEGGMESFLDGMEISPGDESLLLVRLLSYALSEISAIEETAANKKKALALCERIREVVPRDEIDFTHMVQESKQDHDDPLRMTTTHFFQLQIYAFHLVTFHTKLVKHIRDPFTFEVEFHVESDVGEIRFGEQVIQGLRLIPPEIDASEHGVEDPPIPRTSPNGNWVLMYVPWSKDISPENAKQILRYKTVDALEFAKKIAKESLEECEIADEWNLVLAKKDHLILKILRVLRYTVGRDEDDDTFKWRVRGADARIVLELKGELPERKMVTS